MENPMPGAPFPEEPSLESKPTKRLRWHLRAARCGLAIRLACFRSPKRPDEVIMDVELVALDPCRGPGTPGLPRERWVLGNFQTQTILCRL